MLQTHPRVFLPPVKELHYFDYLHIPGHRTWVGNALAKNLKKLQRDGVSRDYLDRLRRIPRTEDAWYASVFDHPDAAGRLCGETTPAYSILPLSGIQHVRAINPAMKIIFIIREPVDRALSSLRMAAGRAGADRVTIDVLERRSMVRGVLARSAYQANMARWEGVFPADQILYMPFAMIRLDPARFMREVESFLGLEPHAYDGLESRVHQTRPVSVDPGIAEALEQELEGERRFLAERFGPDFLEGRSVGPAAPPAPLAAPPRARQKIRQLVIHAGIHRTGTTSIQRFLSNNREALSARGVAYPGDRVHHQHLAWGLKRGEISGKAIVDLVAFQETGTDTAILSAEDFCIHTDLGWVGALAEAVPTRAVFYLRRQDHWLMSWYNQHVKWPFEAGKSRMSPAEFLGTIEDFHWLDYSKLLARWEAALGRDNVSLGVMEKGQVADVVQDFLGRAGLDAAGLAQDGKRENDSLPVHMLEMARYFGLYEMDTGKRMQVLNALRAGLGDKTPVATTAYSPAQRQQVIDRFSAGNRQVAQRYFGRDALFLEPPPAPDAPFFRFPDLTRDELMREWVAPVVRELVGKG